MRIPTVKLRHKRKGNVVKVNQEDWAQDLGRYQYRDYERVGEQHNDAQDPIPVPTAAPRRRRRTKV